MKNKKSLILGIALSLMSASSNAINVIIRNEYKKPIELYSNEGLLNTIPIGGEQKYMNYSFDIRFIKEEGGTIRHEGIRKEFDEIQRLNNRNQNIDTVIITILSNKKFLSFQYGVQLFSGSNMPQAPQRPAPSTPIVSPFKSAEAKMLIGEVTVEQYLAFLKNANSSMKYQTRQGLSVPVAAILKGLDRKNYLDVQDRLQKYHNFYTHDYKVGSDKKELH